MNSFLFTTHAILHEVEEITGFYIACNEQTLQVELELECLGLESCYFKFRDIRLQFTSDILQVMHFPFS